jgi:hypothetical protein
MANTLTALNKKKYSKTIQALLISKSVALGLANRELEGQMNDGNTIANPTTSFLSIQQYVVGNTVSYDDIVTAEETLVINDMPTVAFVLDQVEEDDAGYNIKMDTMDNVAKLLREYFDGKFFGQYVNFTTTYNGGVATTLTNTNTYDTFSDAMAALYNNGVDTDSTVVVMDEFAKAKLGSQAVNSRFVLGDETMKAGWTAMDVAGSRVVIANNLTCVGTFNFGGVNPVAGNTIKIADVTFTFQTTLGATPGNVLVGANTTATAANLVAAINGGAGAGTTYVNFTDKTRANKLRGMTASSSTTVVTLTSTRGYRGPSSFAKVMGDAANKFGQFVTYAIGMQRGSIHAVLRPELKTASGRIPGTYRYEYLTSSRFGLKMFASGAERGIIIPLVARSAE